MLAADAPAEQVLRDVVRQLDLPTPEGPEDVVVLALARAVVATGPALLERHPGHERIAATLAAARAYVAEPSEATHAAYFRAATASYPFGPGEGCYSLVPGDDHATPGSGCRSGAGTLASIAAEVGAERVVGELRAALLPWLDGG